MHSHSLFEDLLGLEPPYHIAEINQEHDDKGICAVHIYIEVEEGFRPVDAQGQTATIHDYQARTWKHLHLFQYPCYLHCRVPKFAYRDGHVKTLEVPWARPQSGFTLHFERFAMFLIELHGTVAQVARQLDVYPQRLWQLIDYYGADYQATEAEMKQVERLGLDETSKRKGHDYVSCFIDLDRGHLLGVEAGKSSDTIETFVKQARRNGLDPGAITEVSIDMSPAFQAGVREHFAEARISFDKFHVSKLVNDAFDQSRRAIARQHGRRFNKWIFFKQHLSASEAEQLAELLAAYPALDRLYHHKRLFSMLWQHEHAEEAGAFLQYWIDTAKELGHKAMRRVATTLARHFAGIVAYFESGVTNALLEGFNSKVQTMKRTARGYRKTENLIRMIHIHCGHRALSPTRII